MNPEKYSRNIILVCPTCGGSELKHDESDIVKCAGCDNEMKREELIQGNDENIQANVEEVKDEIFKDVKKQLKDAFKGFK